MSEAGKEKRFFEGCVKRPLIFGLLFLFFTPFNGGSFILLQVNWCSREFSLHSVKGNHIHLTLVHLEEETLPFSFSPPVSPLVRQANGLVGGEICLPRCLLLLLATRSKLWQTLSTPGRSEELRELDTISLLVLALWALKSEKQRLAILPVLEKLSDSTWFSFCHCIHAQQYKAAPLWPWTHAGETDNGFKRGKRETDLDHWLDTMWLVFLFPILWCNNRHLDIIHCVYHILASIFLVLLFFFFCQFPFTLHPSLSFSISLFSIRMPYPVQLLFFFLVSIYSAHINSLQSLVRNLDSIVGIIDILPQLNQKVGSNTMLSNVTFLWQGVLNPFTLAQNIPFFTHIWLRLDFFARVNT